MLPESLPSIAESSYQSPYSRDSLADTAAIEPEDAVFEEKPSASLRTSTAPPAYYDDDDDIPELPGRGTSPLGWLLIIVAIGALALVASQWSRVARLVGIGGDPTLIATSVDEGDAAVAEGHPSAYANAIEAYGRAVEAGGDTDVDVLAKLSNAYALAAQAQMDGGAAAGSVGSLLEGALSTAQVATSIDSRALDAKLANVDALRLSGNYAQAREQLEDARAMSFSRTAEFYRIDARLSAAEAGGRLANGLRSARQAAELDPDGVRYALLLARAEQASGHDQQARDALAAILAEHPEHPVATTLMAELQAKAATEQEVEAEAQLAEEADAGAEPEADAEAASEAASAPAPASEAAPAPAPVKAPAPVEATAPAKAQATEAKPEAKPAEAPKPKRPKPVQRKPELDEYDRLARAAGSDAFVDGRPPVLDYESNMKNGREELEAGNYARARAYFDSALEVHPGSAEAMDALGDVATAVNDYASALRYYRVAAQRGHPDGYFNLGRTYEQLGRNEEAVSAYYTYVKRRPTGTHAEAARTAIRTLEPRAKLPPEDPAKESDPATP
jgi:lipopolysaccharide biosynthesis regulator YciM